MWRRVNVISVEKVKEERELGQVWPPAAAGAARFSRPPFLAPTPPRSQPRTSSSANSRSAQKEGRKERERGWRTDGEVGRYMLKKGGRDRPTNLENLQLSIGRSRYVVVGPRRSFGRFFICFMGCQTLLSISDSGRERAALDHEKLLCFC